MNQIIVALSDKAFKEARKRGININKIEHIDCNKEFKQLNLEKSNEKKPEKDKKDKKVKKYK